MKLLFLLFACSSVLAQGNGNPEIFLMDMQISPNSITLKNGRNISQNPGYDSQPAFYSDSVLIYAKSRNDQTDIAAYNIISLTETWRSNTSFGGEYSPQRIPKSNEVAAVRLDTTGLQRLYKYNWSTGEHNLLNDSLKIGYFAFFNENKILATVLTGSGMNLVLLDLEDHTLLNIVSGAGRSLHKVPGEETMSYTLINEQGAVELYLLENIEQEPESVYLTTLPPGVQDYVWIDKNRILAGQGTKILLYDMWAETKWNQMADLAEYNIKNITRLAVNVSGDKFALAAEVKEE